MHILPMLNKKLTIPTCCISFTVPLYSLCLSLVVDNCSPHDLPQVKQLSRERPLTHERPHTHNPRDPRKVPARAHLHVSPKRTLKPNGNQGAGDWGEDVVGSSSFPYLPLSLTGGGVPRGGGTTNPGGVGMVGGVRGQSPGIITMAKPMEILMEGHLRS